MLEVALGDGLELAVFVALEANAEAFVMFEALVGLGQDVLDKLLITQAVMVIDHIVEGGFHGSVLHTLEVAAGGGTEPAPVRRAFVHEDHVLHMLTGADRRPESGKTAADDQDVRFDMMVDLQGLHR